MVIEETITVVAPICATGKRLDQLLAETLCVYSRSRLKVWVVEGRVQVNGAVVQQPRFPLFGGEMISVQPKNATRVTHQSEPIALKVVYQDDQLLVIHKSRYQVVHPGAGHPDGTLLNALLHHYPELAALPRAGIVHRLDKETSGLMVIAKTEAAQNYLTAALQARTIVREYQAVAVGAMIAGGTITQPIGRHPQRRIQMAVHPLGKPATTHYRILERFRAHTFLQLRLESGRTHQIRVHLAYLRYPLVGDLLYGGRSCVPQRATASLIHTLQQFKGQALHAARLQLIHPVRGELLTLEAPLPVEMEMLLQQLRLDTAQKKEQEWC